MSNKCANPKCENPIVSLPGKRPRKYCSTKCTSAHWQALHYEPKKKAKNLVELPADFINCEKIGIIRADGTIEELKDFEQLPENFKLAAKGLYKLGIDSTHLQPQEAPETKKQDNIPPKEESVKDEAENEVKVDNSDTLKRIKELEAELKSPPKNPMIGLKNWIAVRENEIQELKSKLKD